MPDKFVPETYEPPHFYSSYHFHFRVLKDSVTEQDYDAIMSSLHRLQFVFGPTSVWPISNMTLEENTASLKVHKQEFETKTAFAYSVFDKSNIRCLGSVYIDPSRSPNYDCEVYFWIRDDSVDLEDELYNTVKIWLKNRWPFIKVVFPGRSVDWETWAKEINNNQ